MTTKPRQHSEPVAATRANGTQQSFQARVRTDTPVEWEYYRHGSILPMALRRLAGSPTNA